MRTRRLTASRIALAGTLLLSCAASVEAGPILVGTPGPGTILDENCIPFGCPGVFGIGFYQQVYSSTVFSEPTLISSIAFFDTFDDSDIDSNAITPATYTLRLSTTSADVGALSTTLADNVGPDDALFFSGVLGGPLGGSILLITGTPFLYSPAAGNLLLQIQVTGAGADSLVFMDSDIDNGLFSRVFSESFSDPPFFADSSGLVTEFNGAAVPEPGTLLLLGSGLAGLARARSRRARTRT